MQDSKETEEEKSESVTATDSFVKEAILNPFSIDTSKVLEADKTTIANDKDALAVKLDRAGINTDVEITDAFSNLAPIFADVLAGDKDAMNRPEFACFNFPAIAKAIKWLSETKSLSDETRADLATNAWRLNFKCKPPTMEEFLTYKYIGHMSDSLHPFIRDTLLDFTDPTKPYRTLVLTSCIGSGKSTLSVILQLFISVHYAMMWNPWKYFGLGMTTAFCQCLGGWNQKKATELLLEPFMNLLADSPFFHRAKFAQDVEEAKHTDDLSEGLLWTSAAKTSALSIQNGVNYKVINGPGSILGTAQPYDCKVYLSDGSYKLMGDIKPGDVVASPTQGSATVESIPYDDVDECYEIELEDSRKTRCNAKHLWTVAYRKDKNGRWIWETVETQFMIDHPEIDFYLPDEEDLKLKDYQ